MRTTAPEYDPPTNHQQTVATRVRTSRRLIVALASACVLYGSPALAEVDLGPDPNAGKAVEGVPPPVEAQRPSELPRPPDTAKPREASPPAAAKPGSKAAKGEPGMMGLPFPMTPEDAPKSLQSLYAFLATEADKRQGGDIGAAIEKLWRYEGGDTVNLLIDRAESFSMKNESERGIPFADAAVDLAPDYAEAWSHRAYLHYRMNNYAAALGDMRRALALEPNHFRALDGMAKILVLLGEKKAALAAYEKLLQVHPNIEGGREARDELKKEVEGQGI